MRLKTSTVVGFSLVSAAISLGLILRFMVFNGFTTSWGEHFRYNENYVWVSGQTLTQEDLEHFAGMRKLSHFELVDCNVAECRLPELEFASKDLWYVSFEGTKGLWDIGFLSTLAVRNLDLSGCSSVTSIDGLDWNALKNLDIDGTSVSDLSAVRGTDLWYISFADTNVEDISPLVEAKELSEVNGANTKVTSIDVLAELPWLVSIDFSGCELANPTRSFASPGMTEVLLRNTGVSDLSCFEECDNLGVVDVSGNPAIDNLLWVNESSRSYLTELNVAYTGLDASDLDFVAECSGLQSLTVDGIELGNLDLCKRLTHLERLSAVGCGLTDVSALRGKSDLTIMLLGYNQLESLEGLPSPTDEWAQAELDLSHNNLTSIRDLPAGKYRYIMVQGNDPDIGRTMPPGVEAYEMAMPWFSGMEDSRVGDYYSFNQIYLLDCPEDRVEQVAVDFPLYRLQRVSELELADLLEANEMDYELDGDYRWYVARLRQEAEGSDGQ